MPRTALELTLLEISTRDLSQVKLEELHASYAQIQQIGVRFQTEISKRAELISIAE